MQSDYSISLSFLPLVSGSFSFTIYRLEHSGQKKADLPHDVVNESLPISHDTPDQRKKYWVSLNKIDGLESFECKEGYNQYLTRDFLLSRLIASCRAVSTKIHFYEEKDFARKRVVFKLQTYPEGETTVWLQAYYLKSTLKFGFLIDFSFRKGNDVPFSKRVQQLSLSLDQYGKENKSFYADRYTKIQEFINRYFSDIFPLQYEHGVIEVARKLVQLPANTLNNKQYLFCKDQSDGSQYMGLKRYCPLAGLDQKPVIFFVYREQNRLASLDLYKALRGETFPNVFPGTEKMFGFAMTPDNVKGIPVSNFKEEEMRRVRDTVLSENRTPVLVVLVAPWDDEELEDSQDYFRAKHIFVSALIPSQVVRLYTLERDTRLQWSASNIALQCFAKLGGKPWKVQPRNSRCLIIGVGQSHREAFSDGKRHIEKYYAYSVLTDSSGLFKELRILGHSNDSLDYLTQLKKNIENIVLDHRDTFNRFVIHAPYKIRKDELESFQEVFANFGQTNLNQFVVLKINTSNDFFGYSQTNNSLVPFESTYVSLSRNDYLVWFEGLQYHNPKVNRRYSHPVLITFHYSSVPLSPKDQLDFLQDAVNLSGANWRGFNAKSLPVSIYYAQLIAGFNKKFDELDLPELSLDNLLPWFL